MLTQKNVDRGKKPGRYRDGEVKGLCLKVTDTGAKSWVLRYERHGKEHFMGLGSASEFTLKEARERARAARQLLADGIDPLADRQAKRVAAKLAEARKLTFAEAAQRYFDRNESGWTSASHRDAFLRTLKAYAFPAIGDMDVAVIDTPDILRAIEPHWKSDAATITADRTRNRIEQVIDWAIVRGHRPPGTNPARWKGHLDQVLPAPRKVAPIRHHAAMRYQDMPQFMADLRGMNSVAARALELLITCSLRASEVTGATWDEIDLDAVRIDPDTNKKIPDPVWNIPAARMKARKPHRVPLSPAAVALLRALPREKGNPRVFIGHRSDSLSKMSMNYVMQALGQKNVTTIHGFRSTFRDWAGEDTSFAPDICEAALAHVRGDKTIQAYARGDLFNKRRRLMDAWAAYCASPPTKTDDKVVTIRRKA